MYVFASFLQPIQTLKDIAMMLLSTTSSDMNVICLLLSNCHTSKKLTTYIYTKTSQQVVSELNSISFVGYFLGDSKTVVTLNIL